MDDLIINLFNPSNEIYQISVALFLGIFIGLRKEIFLQKEKTSGIFGIRTLPLFVILGTISTFFQDLKFLPILFFIGILFFIIIAYYNGVFKLNKIGLTSEFSALIMFWVGVLIGQEQIILAVFITIVTGILSAYKNKLHSFAQNFSLKEWSGTLQLLIITILILPILPKEPVDSFGILIPFDIWVLVILISFIGFCGYFFEKYFNAKKSILLTSFFGSIISSTITTSSLSSQSKEYKNYNLILSAIMLSISVMQLRIILEILVISKSFNWNFLVASITMFLTSIIFSFFFFNKSKKYKTPIVEKKCLLKNKSKKPFELIPSLKFTLLFIITLFTLHLSKEYFGNAGAYVSAGFSAAIDSDAVVLSILESFKMSKSENFFVSQIILIAISINTLSKIFYISIFGNKELTRKSLFPITTVVLFGLLSYLSLFF